MKKHTFKPVIVELEKDKTYAWCACGKTKNEPFCDGSHKKTDIIPLKFTAEKNGKFSLCTCKQTKKAPFCDGTHAK